jgi:hypothetical protein
VTYYVATPQQLVLLAHAVEALLGLTNPVRGVVHGGPDFLPTTFAGFGTPGWTDSVFRGSWVSADLSLAAVPIVPDMLAFAGQIVVVGEHLVEFPSEEDGVEELPDALLEANGAWWWSGEEL